MFGNFFKNSMQLTCLSNCTVRCLSQRTEDTFWYKNLYTMFIGALVTIAPNWKQPRCLSMDWWLNKLWYIYTMEYYSLIIIQRIDFWYTRQCGWISRELRWVKKSILKGCILYYSIYITFFETQNYRNGLEISGCQGSRKEWAWQGGRHGCKMATGRIF